MLEKSQNARSAIMGTLRSFLDCIKRYPYVFIVIIAAFWLYMLVIVPSGSEYCTVSRECGIFFWGAHEHDGIWHIALIETAFKSYPFNLPIFNGAKLEGYNFLFDFLLFLLTKVGFEASFLYFKMMPIIWFVSFMGALYIFVKNVHTHFFAKYHRNTFGWFLLLNLTVVFFAGSFGYVFTLIHEKTFTNASSLFPMQGAVAMTNPQFMWSLIFIMLLLDGYASIVLNARSLTWKKVLITGLSIFLALGLKIYSIAFVGGFLACVMVMLIWRRELKVAIVLSLVSLIVGIMTWAIFYSNSVRSHSVFSFHAFALVKSMYADARLLNLPEIGVKWDVLEASGRFAPSLLFIQLRASILFIVMSLGLRSFALIGQLSAWLSVLKKRAEKRDILIISLGFMSAICALPTFFLVQSGEWWNTIQFIYYAIFISNFLFSFWLFEMTHGYGRLGKIVTMGLLVALFLPIQIDIIRTFTGLDRASFVNAEEIEALGFLKSQNGNVVLTQNYFSKNTDDYATDAKFDGKKIPLPDLIDTAYVSAYSGKIVYFSDENQLKLLSVSNYLRRKTELQSLDCQILKREVDSVYLRKTHRQIEEYRQCAQESKFKKVFDGVASEIWSK